MNNLQDPSTFSKPILTEPGVKYFLNETLKQCHQFKEKHHNSLFNAGMFIGFLVTSTRVYEFVSQLS